MMLKRCLSMFLIIFLQLSSFGEPVWAEEQIELFYDNFNTAGLWTISEGEGANISFTGDMRIDAKNTNASAAIESSSWEDYTVQTRIKPSKTDNENDMFEIIFKDQNSKHRYAIIWEKATNKIRLAKDNTDFKRKVPYFMQEGDVSNILKYSEWNDLSIVSKNDNIKVNLNKETIINFTDQEPIKYGGVKIAVESVGKNTFSFGLDYFKITCAKNQSESNIFSGNVMGGKKVFSDSFDETNEKWNVDGSAQIQQDDLGKYMEIKSGNIEANTGNLSDFYFDSYIKSQSGNYIIYLRHMGINLYYKIVISKEKNGSIAIVKRADNNQRVLAEKSNLADEYQFDSSQWNLLRLRCNGDNIGVFIGSEKKPLLWTRDSNTGITEGKIIISATDSNVELDDAQIYTGGTSVNIPELEPIQPIDKPNMNDNDLTDDVYATFYVSTVGNDSDAGTYEKPFRSIERSLEEIEKINSNMTGNIVVNVGAGVYELSSAIEINKNNSGKNGYYVIFNGDENAVLSAGKNVGNNWRKANNNVWKIPVEPCYVTGFKEFYVNGERKQRAGKWCNNPEMIFYNDENSEYEVDGFYADKMFLNDIKNPEQLQLITNVAWRSFHVGVKDMIDDPKNPERSILIMEQPAFEHSYAIGPDGANLKTRSLKYRIENAYELLDEPGEWYYSRDEKMLYYYPDSYEDLNTASCYIPGIDQILTIKGSSLNDRVENVKFCGFEFSNTGWEEATRLGYVTNQTPFIKEINPNAEFGTQERNVQYAVDINFAENIKLEQNKFTNTGASAIHIINGVDDVSIVGNVFDDIGDSALVIGSIGETKEDTKNPTEYIDYYHYYAMRENEQVPRNIYISNNIFNDIGSEYNAGIAIAVTYADTVYILHNEISNVGLNPISLGWGWAYAAIPTLRNHCVMYNVLRDYNYKQSLHDLAGVYMLSASMGTTISNNYIYNDFGGSYGAIYYDQGASYITAENNVLKDVNSSVFILSSERHDNLVINNYSTTPNYTNAGINSYILDLNVVSNYNWNRRAMQIMNEAGLQNDFQYLSNKLSDSSVLLDRVYKMSCYSNGSSKMLKFGSTMNLDSCDSSAQAIIYNETLYLPKKEMEDVAYKKIPTYMGLNCGFDEENRKAIMSFSTDREKEPTVINAEVDTKIWNIDGRDVEIEHEIILLNGKPMYPVSDVFKCLGIKKKIIYDSEIAAICENGIDISFSDNEGLSEFINSKIHK